MSESQSTPMRVAVLVETNREYARGLLEGINLFALERGDWAIHFEVRTLDSPLPRWLDKLSVDGVMARVDNRATARKLLDLNLPVIDLRGGVAGSGIPFIGANNSTIARRVAEHLKSLGLENFAFYARPPGENRFQDQRCKDFVREIEAAGHNCHVFKHPQTAKERLSWRIERREAIRWLRSLPKPIGIMAPHDEFGHRLLLACRDASIEVPRQVAVASVDNDALICNMGTPTLTSIDVASKEIGYQAAKILDAAMRKQIELPQDAFIEIEPGEVISRESTRLAGISDPVAQKALVFIRDHASRGITVADVLAHVGASQRGLERKLKAAIGRTPHQEIMRVRIDLAKQLLFSSTLPLQNISHRCGFDSYKYFSDAFLSSTGLRPSAYRSDRGNLTTSGDREA